MIASAGYQAAFIRWGIIQGVTVIVAAFFLKSPPVGWMPKTWRLKGSQEVKKRQTRQDFTRDVSRLAFTVLVLAMRHPLFQFLCRFGQLVGNFPQKLRRAPLRCGRYLFIQIFPQTCNFVVQLPPEFFEFVHRSSSPVARRVSQGVYRNAF